MGASQAVDLAARVGEIGFAEFTSDLITGVFSALTDANVQQTQQYIDLVETVGASLTEFINGTEESIGPEEIEQFLAAIGIDLTDPVSTADADTINAAVATEDGAGVGGSDNQVATAGSSATVKDTIREAVARRIAANRYDFLQQMVKLGVIRVVVDHGEIETRLTFRTTGRTSRGERSAASDRTAGFLAGVGLVGAGLAGLGAGVGVIGAAAAGYGAYNHMSVKTAHRFNRDVTGSRVQIYGRVSVHFKTDYQPLNPTAAGPTGP